MNSPGEIRMTELVAQLARHLVREMYSSVTLLCCGDEEESEDYTRSGQTTRSSATNCPRHVATRETRYHPKTT